MGQVTYDSGKLVAIDWGTTNVRVALLDMAGQVLEERRGESGVGTFSAAQFGDHFDHLTRDWPAVPAIAAGMVGSRQGWQEACYLPCPTSTQDLVQGLYHFDHNGRSVTIIPGIMLNDGVRSDVMRGEESQIAGFLTSEPNFSGTLLMPGTHSKWVRVEDQTVVDFQTYMTGEVFEAISQHTILRHSLAEAAYEPAQFHQKTLDLLQRGKSAESGLFALRARQLLCGAEAEDLHLELSALLILSELQAGQTDGFQLDDNIVLIGSAGLTALYQASLQAMGHAARCIRGTGLVWAALHNFAQQSKLIVDSKA